MKHPKYAVGAHEALAEWDAPNDFDDRTLRSLVNTLDGGRPHLPHDGHNEDEPYDTLPIERWTRLASWKERP